MAFASLLRNAFMGIVAAVGAVVLTLLIADAISGPLMVSQVGADNPEEVPLGGAVIATVIAGILGTVLAFVTSRMRRSTILFVSICVVVLVLYGLFAWTSAETQSTGIWLNVMHLAAAVPIVGQLSRWVASRPAVTKTDVATADTADTATTVSADEAGSTNDSATD